MADSLYVPTSFHFTLSIKRRFSVQYAYSYFLDFMTVHCTVQKCIYCAVIISLSKCLPLIPGLQSAKKQNTFFTVTLYCKNLALDLTEQIVQSTVPAYCTYIHNWVHACLCHLVSIVQYSVKQIYLHIAHFIKPYRDL